MRNFLVLFFLIPSLSWALTYAPNYKTVTKSTKIYNKNIYLTDDDIKSRKVIRDLPPNSIIMLIKAVENNYCKVMLEDGTVGFLWRGFSFDCVPFFKLDESEIEISKSKYNTAQSNKNSNDYNNDKSTITKKVIIKKVNLPRTSVGCTNIQNTRFPIYSSC